MRAICPRCNHPFQIANPVSGDRVRCPSCQATFVLGKAPTPIIPPIVATKSCPFCAETIIANAKKCRHCGEFLDPVSRQRHEATADAGTRSRDAGAAAAMSFIVPGLGQVYNGEIMKGIVCFVMCVLLYATIVFGLILHVMLVRDAYSTALYGKRPNDQQPWYRRNYYLPGDRRGHDAP